MRAKYLGDIPTRALKRRSSWRGLTPSSAAAAPTSGERASSRAASSTSASALPRSSPRSARSTSDRVEQLGQTLQAEIAGRDHAVREFLHRHTEQLAGAARPETDSQNAGGAGARKSSGPVSCPARKHRGCVRHSPSSKDSNGCPRLRINSGRPSGTTRWTVPGAAPSSTQ